MNLNRMEEHFTMEKILGGLLFIRMTVSLCSCPRSNVFSTRPFFVSQNLDTLSNNLPPSVDTNLALHFYHHDNAYTSNGVLNITTELKTNGYKAFNEKTKKYYADYKHVQTAMLQGWNKFCFIGGIVEFRAQLPGDAENGGLWPARKSVSPDRRQSVFCLLCFLYYCILHLSTIRLNAQYISIMIDSVWMLGNLARATYVGSSNFMWPYSYNICNPSERLSQEINACNKENHYGMEPFRGRGSPEIDIIESMQGNRDEKLPNTFIRRPYQSASLQVRSSFLLRKTHHYILGFRNSFSHI